MSQSSIYAEIGGREAVERVVDDFYDRVLDDPLLEPYFAETDMEALFAHQVQFVSAVAGGPVDYDGADMQAAHEGMGITEEAFGQVAEYLHAALVENGVGEATADSIIGEVAALEDDVVGK
ncbi:group I truncated hemoglobin [Halolamina salifodinae]|uniref:Hemoglobin n=1 Tax=Halolamina salifodinae TaxID=1202767 RepID=A0A8T4GWX4_9EURY|nr:group 1 truncated hemoglobin [Halolamina salifodinae]MBP1986164.1 hemoglobin [Halolamina salifodinae]